MWVESNARNCQWSRCFMYVAQAQIWIGVLHMHLNGEWTTKVHLKTEWRWLRELWSCAWMWPVILMTIANVAFDIFPCKSFVALSLRLWRDIIQNALATAVQDTQLQTAIGTSPKAKTNVQSMCGNDDECMSMCTCTLYIHVSVLGMCVCSSCLHVSVLGMCMCTLYGLTDHDS